MLHPGQQILNISNIKLHRHSALKDFKVLTPELKAEPVESCSDQYVSIHRVSPAYRSQHVTFNYSVNMSVLLLLWLHSPFNLAFASLTWVLLGHDNLMNKWCDLFRFCVKFNFLKRIKSRMDETLGATRCSLTTGRTMFHCTFIVSRERH